MKKFALTMIIIASVLVIAGISMIGISAAFFPWSWKENFSQEIRKFNGDNERIVPKTISASAATLKTIDISMINEKIEVVKGGDKVVITYPENSNSIYEIIHTKDKVSIRKEIKLFFWPFTHWFHLGENQNTVIIQIPEKMKIQTLNLNSVNGKITAESVRVANAHFSVINGNITVTNSQFDQFSTSNTNGSCDSTGCVIKSLDFRTVNGTISVRRGDITKMRFRSVNGKIQATDLTGKATDYSISCGTVNGSVYVNDNLVSSRGSYKSLTSGNRSIDVDTVNGKIEISTLIK